MSRRNPVRPQILDSGTVAAADHPRITTSSEFLEFVRQRRTEAERRKEDLEADVARLENARQRVLTDAETEAVRLDAEINSRLADLAHEEEIIARADAALTIDVPPVVPFEERPAPQLSPRRAAEGAAE